MEKMNDLRDLLKHEIMDLYSAEEQIIKAMPAMIKRAKNPELKQSLQQHLKVTEAQRTRLDKVQQIMEGGTGNSTENSSGLLSRLFKRSHFCRGMQGIIEEGERVMAEDMSPEVMDAAIIACSQKIEHYEICGYGTARAFAEELGMTDVASLLEQTLDEEYEADDRLTALAVNRLNQRAEKGVSRNGGNRSTGAGSTRGEGSRQRTPREAMEMEMASSKRGSASKQAATKGRGSTQTLGNARSTASDAGSTGRGTTAASSGRAGKTTTKGTTSTRGSQSGGRGATSGRS